jgi:hypothetical protein
MARYWYAYNGNNSDQVPGSYTKAILSPEDFCEGGSLTCTISAPDGGNSPTVISQNIKNYLIIAKATRTYYPTLGKPYVYTRP